MGLRKLRDQHKEFVRRYIEGFKPGVGYNPKKAVIEAGYSPNHAEKKASELLNDPLIQAEIERYQKKIENRTVVRMRDIVSELCMMGFTNIKDFLDDNGKIRPLEELPGEVTAAVSEYTEKRIEGKDGKPDTVTRKLKLCDKRAAMMDVAKIQGYLRNKGETPASSVFVMNLKEKRT